MTFSPDGQYRLQGWMVSAVFHGLALTVVLGLMAQVKPVMPKEVFKWDVALVEPQRTQVEPQAAPMPTREPAKPTRRQAAPAPAQPHMVTRAVQTREATPVVQRETRQVVETSQPIQQTMAVQTRTETVTPIQERRPAEVQQSAQTVVESIAPVVQQEAVTTEPTVTAAPVQARPEVVTPVREQQLAEAQQATQSAVESMAPVVQQKAVTAEPVIAPARVLPVETRAIETAVVTRDPELPSFPAPTPAAVSDATPVETPVREAPTHVAMATRPIPAAKADYGWLAESLRRRLAEIKRYPSAARLNGWEGKVVLRAVIRSDGHLSDVKVHRSSGHESLDNAAMEALRLVCPLPMTNAVGAAEIAVLVPMVYSLGG